jgi:hypothetical protein
MGTSRLPYPAEFPALLFVLFLDFGVLHHGILVIGDAFYESFEALA